MYFIHSDISKAHTLPSDFYRSKTAFDRVAENIMATTWQYVADADVVAETGQYHPFTLLDGVLDEPLLLTRDQSGQTHCLSNVCTHRGKIIAEKAGKGKLLRCGYHGRCFDLHGQFKSMPAFENVVNFPTEADHLTTVPFHQWLGMIFVSLHPKIDFGKMVKPIQDRLGWLPFDTLQLVSTGTRDYKINANWALYCDNYLEGFHVPFVHPDLNRMLDFKNYTYELFDYCNLQLGVAKEGEPSFDLPPDSVDYGKNIYAYYYWVFPNMMFNFYPWGLSFNYVMPLSQDSTCIRYRTYFYNNTPFNYEDNCIDQTEIEDQAVVESVQLGLQSRHYKKGRFSPSMEKCVHHFHRLVSEFMQ